MGIWYPQLDSAALHVLSAVHAMRGSALLLGRIGFKSAPCGYVRNSEDSVETLKTVVGHVATRTPDLYRVKVALHARWGQMGADGRIFD